MSFWLVSRGSTATFPGPWGSLGKLRCMLDHSHVIEPISPNWKAHLLAAISVTSLLPNPLRCHPNPSKRVQMVFLSLPGKYWGHSNYRYITLTPWQAWHFHPMWVRCRGPTPQGTWGVAGKTLYWALNSVWWITGHKNRGEAGGFASSATTNCKVSRTCFQYWVTINIWSIQYYIWWCNIWQLVCIAVTCNTSPASVAIYAREFICIMFCPYLVRTEPYYGAKFFFRVAIPLCRLPSNSNMLLRWLVSRFMWMQWYRITTLIPS